MDRFSKTLSKYPTTMLVLLLLASTMTTNAFMVGKPSTTQQSLQQRYSLDEHKVSSGEEMMTRTVVDHEKPLVQATASVATGTILALSLFFAPLQTADSSSSFLAVQPAVAAKTVATEPVAVAPQELQLKSAKAAMAAASQSVKGVESKIKGLEASMKKTEQSIGAAEKSVQKSKKALQQAEKSYRDLQKQKKPAKVLDKESQKVVKAKLAFQQVSDGLTSAKGAKIEGKTQMKVLSSELKAAKNAEKQAASKLATAESAYSKYQKQLADAKKAAEAKAKAKRELEETKAREKAARDKIAAAKGQKRAEERKQQIQTQTKDLQTELKNLQQKRKQASNPKVYDDQIATVQQKLEALKQASKDISSTKK